jgi:hypothetical protein
VNQGDKAMGLATAILCIKTNDGIELPANAGQTAADVLQKGFETAGWVCIAKEQGWIAVFRYRGAVHHLGEFSSELLVLDASSEDVVSWLANVINGFHVDLLGDIFLELIEQLTYLYISFYTVFEVNIASGKKRDGEGMILPPRRVATFKVSGKLKEKVYNYENDRRLSVSLNGFKRLEKDVKSGRIRAYTASHAGKTGMN